MNNPELAKKIADVLDTVQECQGVQQAHEIEAIVLEILNDVQPQKD